MESQAVQGSNYLTQQQGPPQQQGMPVPAGQQQYGPSMVPPGAYGDPSQMGRMQPQAHYQHQVQGIQVVHQGYPHPQGYPSSAAGPVPPPQHYPSVAGGGGYAQMAPNGHPPPSGGPHSHHGFPMGPAGQQGPPHPPMPPGQQQSVHHGHQQQPPVLGGPQYPPGIQMVQQQSPHPSQHQLQHHYQQPQAASHPPHSQQRIQQSASMMHQSGPPGSEPHTVVGGGRVGTPVPISAVTSSHNGGLGQPVAAAMSSSGGGASYGQVPSREAPQQGAPPPMSGAPPPAGPQSAHEIQQNYAMTQKAIAEMEEQGMQNDPRYHHMVQLSNRYRAYYPQQMGPMGSQGHSGGMYSSSGPPGGPPQSTALPAQIQQAPSQAHPGYQPHTVQPPVPPGQAGVPPPPQPTPVGALANDSVPDPSGGESIVLGATVPTSAGESGVGTPGAGLMTNGMDGAPGGAGATSSSGAEEPKAFSADQMATLKAQIQVYRLLSRNMPVPSELDNVACPKDMIIPKKKHTSLLPEPYVMPGGQIGKLQQTPYSLPAVCQLQMQRQNRISPITKPSGIDPHEILRERENRIANRIGQDIAALEALPVDLDADLRRKVEIKLRGLRLLSFQKQLRSDITSAIRADTTLETALNPRAYRRTKMQTLREARVTEKLEKQQKIELERRKRQRHQEFLVAVLSHAKEFREFHRRNQYQISKLRKAVSQYHANTEREKRKEEEKREKDRIQRLMVEDEDGYRQLLDQKKDRRLVYLLQQTDDYVVSLVKLVKEHQINQYRLKKQERKSEKRRRKLQEQLSRGEILDPNDPPVKVKEMATGKVLQGMEAPRQSQVAKWLELHAGWETLPTEEGDSSDSEDEEERRLLAKAEPLVEKKVDVVLDESMNEESKNRAIIEAAKKEDDEAANQRCENADYYKTAHTISEKVHKQPDIMVGGTLKPYQIQGLEWLVSLYNNNLNGILADEMGLGKTIQTIALITYLMEKKRNNGPFLIIVPLSTLSNWEMEFFRWAPSAKIITYKGVAAARKTISTDMKRVRFNVLLTTYDYIMRDKSVLSKISWKYMIIDEGHRMKNSHCKLTFILNTYYVAPHRVLLTGTPLQNKLPELWALLNFLLPSIFKCCQNFEQWFNAPFATTGEKKVELNQEETMLIIRRLHKVLRPFLLRRMKKEVESQLPEKTEYVVKCEMSSLQKIIYHHIAVEGAIVASDGENSKARAVQNIMMQLRKICNHPFLFEEYEAKIAQHLGYEGGVVHGPDLYRVAGKFELLDRILPKLKATNHKCLIFCQMTLVMDIMGDYFAWKGEGYEYLRIDGSTAGEKRGDLLATFNDPESKYFVFILSTRAGGLGLNLQSADTVILFDSDWNPFQDMQAQARAHRIGQKHEVRVLRFITANSIEEKILAAAQNKLNMDAKVIQAGLFNQRSTGSEQKQVLQEILASEVEGDEEENDAVDDETINQMIARSEDEFNMFHDMDIERRRLEARDPQRKPRLIEKAELPAFFMKDTDDIRRMRQRYQDEKDFGKGARARKEVDYSQDSWSEKQWLKAIDEDIGDELSDEEEEPIIPQKKPKGKGRGKGKGKKGAEEEPPTPSSSTKSGGGGRGRRRGLPPSSNVEDDGDDDDDDDSIPQKRRKFSNGRDSTAGDSRSSSKLGRLESLQQKLEAILTYLIDHKDSTGRVVSEAFMQLPTRKDMPAYYAVIDRPMDFKKIKNKLRDNKYRCLEDFEADVELLCDNAQSFNEEGSQIFNDSMILRAVFHGARERVMSSTPNGGATTGNDKSAGKGTKPSPVTNSDLRETESLKGANTSRPSSKVGDVILPLESARSSNLPTGAPANKDVTFGITCEDDGGGSSSSQTSLDTSQTSIEEGVESSATPAKQDSRKIENKLAKTSSIITGSGGDGGKKLGQQGGKSSAGRKATPSKFPQHQLPLPHRDISKTPIRTPGGVMGGIEMAGDEDDLDDDDDDFDDDSSSFEDERLGDGSSVVGGATAMDLAAMTSMADIAKFMGAGGSSAATMAHLAKFMSNQEMLRQLELAGKIPSQFTSAVALSSSSSTVASARPMPQSSSSATAAAAMAMAEMMRGAGGSSGFRFPPGMMQPRAGNPQTAGWGRGGAVGGTSMRASPQRGTKLSNAAENLRALVRGMRPPGSSGAGAARQMMAGSRGQPGAMRGSGGSARMPMGAAARMGQGGPPGGMGQGGPPGGMRQRMPMSANQVQRLPGGQLRPGVGSASGNSGGRMQMSSAAKMGSGMQMRPQMQSAGPPGAFSPPSGAEMLQRLARPGGAGIAGVPRAMVPRQPPSGGTLIDGLPALIRSGAHGITAANGAGVKSSGRSQVSPSGGPGAPTSDKTKETVSAGTAVTSSGEGTSYVQTEGLDLSIHRASNAAGAPAGAEPRAQISAEGNNGKLPGGEAEEPVEGEKVTPGDRISSYYCSSSSSVVIGDSDALLSRVEIRPEPSHSNESSGRRRKSQPTKRIQKEENPPGVEHATMGVAEAIGVELYASNEDAS